MRSPLRSALLVVLVSLFVYNANLQRIASGDTVPASLLPFSLWLDGSLAADRFYPYLQQHAPTQARAFVVKDGHAYSSYPIAAPLLIAPLYAPAAMLVAAQGWETGRIVTLAGILEKLSASLVAALSVGLFFLLALRLSSARTAWVLALAYALGTGTWTISSQALWQHGPGNLAMIAALLGLHIGWGDQTRRTALIVAGMSAALAAAIRPTNILFLGALYVALLAGRCGRRPIALFSIFPAAILAAVAAYNLQVHGRLTGGYDGSFDGSFWEGWAGMLVSPGRGLLVYTPLVLFSMVGAIVWWRGGRHLQTPVYLVAILFSLSQILLLAKWRIWWGGHCYGPRLLTDTLPCLMLLVIPAAGWIWHSPWRRGAFVTALVWSVFIQAVGAFCYPPSEWDEVPVAVGQRRSRLWDWRDNPVARGLSVGPRLGPSPKFYYKIRNIIINQ